MKLYDIPMEAAEIEAVLADSGGELTPEIEQRINDFMNGGKDKIEAAAMVVKSLLSDASVCDGEAKRLKERAASLNQSAERLKGLILGAVDSAFAGKIKTAKFTIWGQTSAPTVSFELLPGTTPAALLPIAPQFVRQHEPELNKSALGAAHKAGEKLPEQFIVTELPGTRFLRIK